jgi:hypothetical protein
MTAHKAQGQTLEQAIIDLQSCFGTESAYLMASRVKSLNGLAILRPFDKCKIQSRQSEDSRKEAKRLEYLNLHTITQVGNTEESASARETLGNSYDQLSMEMDENTSSPPALPADSTERLQDLQAFNQILISRAPNTTAHTIAGTSRTIGTQSSNYRNNEIA